MLANRVSETLILAPPACGSEPRGDDLHHPSQSGANLIVFCFANLVSDKLILAPPPAWGSERRGDDLHHVSQSCANQIVFIVATLVSIQFILAPPTQAGAQNPEEMIYTILVKVAQIKFLCFCKSVFRKK